ncbi:MAG: hypothetical protein Pars93KO_27970 [Parasphingorhabdus sp.]
MNMLDSRIWAEPFRYTVEGRPYTMSVKIKDNCVVLCTDQPVEEGAKPKPELVTELLTSDIQLSERVRRMIADWLDPNGDSAFCFKQFKRRNPGRYPGWDDANIEIGLYVEERIERKEKFEAVVAEACRKFDIGRTTATQAYRKIRRARISTS